MLLILIGLGFKVAAVPFHMWAPDAYEGAPTPVTAFMAAGVKAAAFGALVRVLGVAFARTELAYGASGWASTLGVLAVLTMTFGNLAAVRQENIKRLLAYSSIAHAGYLLLGVVAMAVAGGEARGPLLFYLLAYTFTTIGAFGVVAWLGNRGDERLQLDDWAGLASRHPAAALAMTIFLLSLGGVPPTAGFFAKFYLFRVALTRPGMMPLVIIAVLNSVISVYYYLRVVTAMYFREVGREPQPLRSPAMNAALWIAALVTLAIGIAPGWVIDAASAAILGS
jgi:NADH-quinone oxidoreductase subunit N